LFLPLSHLFQSYLVFLSCSTTSMTFQCTPPIRSLPLYLSAFKSTSVRSHLLPKTMLFLSLTFLTSAHLDSSNRNPLCFHANLRSLSNRQRTNRRQLLPRQSLSAVRTVIACHFTGHQIDRHPPRSALPEVPSRSPLGYASLGDHLKPKSRRFCRHDLISFLTKGPTYFVRSRRFPNPICYLNSRYTSPNTLVF
jgi:hypothetical protein